MDNVSRKKYIQIQAQSKYEETLIVIQSIGYNYYCDFQEEGLTAAIIEWAAKAFGFECPEIPVEYDREHQKIHMGRNDHELYIV